MRTTGSLKPFHVSEISRKNISSFLSMLLLHRQRSKRPFCALLSLLLLCLLAYNSATIFCVRVPVQERGKPEPASFLPENVTGKSRAFPSVSPSPKLLSAVQYSVKEGSSRVKLNTRLVVSTNVSAVNQAKRRKRYRLAKKVLGSDVVRQFEARVMKFFKGNSSDSSCQFQFFMTWISSVKSFGDRESFSVESLFKAHPNGCLIIVSSSLDSRSGMKILRPFLDKGFKVAAISPDFNYLFKGTAAQAWYSQLKRGKVNPGEVSLGQNLSNLLRMGLLYRFGGIYLDTDVIVLKSFGGLRNAIGAQAANLATGNWSRLNNAVMIFDKGHPLIHKFIEEFALTFDGNKWGHNGPYLVSRVVSRLSERPGFNFTVLPPRAFYPVDWNKIGGLFHGPRSSSHSKWILAKLRQIRSQSYALHLWNKQSRRFVIQKGSIIQQLLFSTRVTSNSSSLPVFPA